MYDISGRKDSIVGHWLSIFCLVLLAVTAAYAGAQHLHDRAEPQQVSDYISIQKVLARYCRGADRMDRELLNSVYWDDGNADYGSFKGSPRQFVDWLLHYEDIKQVKGSSQHFLGQSSIVVEGDAARVETYFTARYVQAAVEGDVLVTSGGRYLDKFERRKDEWRIKTRQLVLDFRGKQPFVSLAATHLGLRSKEDPSYKLLPWQVTPP